LSDRKRDVAVFRWDVYEPLTFHRRGKRALGSLRGIEKCDGWISGAWGVKTFGGRDGGRAGQPS